MWPSHMTERGHSHGRRGTREFRAVLADGSTSLGGMTLTAPTLFAFEDSFVRELEGLYVPWQGTPVAAPRLLALNDDLAAELGVDADALRTEGGVAILAGSAAPAGAGRGPRRPAPGGRRPHPRRPPRPRRRHAGRPGLRRPSLRLVLAAPRR